MEHDMCIVTFATTHHALRFEREFSGTGMIFDLIPVPREISASCGLAAKILPAEAEKFAAECRSRKVPFEAIYKLHAGSARPPQVVSRGGPQPH